MRTSAWVHTWPLERLASVAPFQKNDPQLPGLWREKESWLGYIVNARHSQARFTLPYLRRMGIITTEHAELFRWPRTAFAKLSEVWEGVAGTLGC